MMLVVAALLAGAAVSLGFRSVGRFLGGLSHPVDRLAIVVSAGVVLIVFALGVSSRFHVFEAGLGLTASLAPVGVFDLAKWWYRSSHPLPPWLVRAHGPRWLVALRWLLVAGGLMACAGAFGAIAGPPAPPPQ